MRTLTQTPSWLAIVSIAALGLVMMTTPTKADHSRSKKVSELHVSGRGEVRTDPDLAVVTLGVVEEDKEAGLAQAAVNRVARSILAAITELGIEPSDVQTSRLNLHPIYDRGENRRKPLVIGFRASNTVTIRVLDLDLVGPVVDAAISSGANEIQGVNFQLDDDQDARLEALQLAVQEARSKAEAMASALGLPLGPVLMVNEGGARIEQPVYQEAMMMRSAAADSSTPVSQGKVNVQAQVSVAFALGTVEED